jgi:hypothetical protein
MNQCNRSNYTMVAMAIITYTAPLELNTEVQAIVPRAIRRTLETPPLFL